MSKRIYVDDWKIEVTRAGTFLSGRDRYRGGALLVKCKWGESVPRRQHDHSTAWWVKHGYDGKAYFLGRKGPGYIFEEK